MIVTLAWPPPSHIVTRPYRPPVRSSACSSVVSSRAPVAPSGWPSAIAPPHDVDPVQVGTGLPLPGQHHAGERLVDLDQVDLVQGHPGPPQRVRGRRDRRGEHQNRVVAARADSGRSGPAAAARAPAPPRGEATSSAAAASAIWLDSAAVIRPPSRSGSSAAIFASRGVPARALVGRHLAVRDDLGLERARHRWRCDRPLVAGQRVTLHLGRGRSPTWPRSCRPSGTARSPRSPYRSRHPADPLNGSSKPYAWPASIAAAIGIWLMFCTPPATTRSAVSLITACAAKCTACWDEPHCRSTVTPGTASGRPAASHAVRAMSPGLRADRVHAAEDDVVDGQRIDAGAVQQRPDDVRAQVGRVRAGQAAAAAADRRPDRVDQERLGHGPRSPPVTIVRTRSILLPACSGGRMHLAYTPEQEQLRQELRELLRRPDDPRDAPRRWPTPAATTATARPTGSRPPARPGRLAGAGLASRVRRPRRLHARPADLHRRGGDRRGAGAVPDHQHRRPDDHAVRHRRAEGALPAQDRRRRDPLLHRLLRARGRHRPGRAAHPGGAGRRRATSSTARRCGPA